MDTYLIVLSSLVILSYLFALAARLTKIPHVLFLLAIGIALRYFAARFGLVVPRPDFYVNILGAVGLILIVLEGALGITIKRESLLTIRKALDAAVCILVLTVGGIALFFHYILMAGWYMALVNALPFGVLSSAITISAVGHLSQEKKDFLVYESVFSDIVGIVSFGILLRGPVFSMSMAVDSCLAITITILVAIFSSLLMIAFIIFIKFDVKVFIVLAAIILLYALGELFGLSPLLIVFIFGLFLANPYIAFEAKVVKRRADVFVKELEQFRSIAVESSFIIRTFFFILLGYSLVLKEMGDIRVLIMGVLAVAVIYLVRSIYLMVFSRIDMAHVLMTAPRGLVSILLFYAIPEKLLVPGVSRGVLFLVVVATSLVMALAMVDGDAESKAKLAKG